MPFNSLSSTWYVIYTDSFYLLYTLDIPPIRFVFQVNSEGCKMLPDDGRLLPKHVRSNTQNKWVVQIRAYYWLFLIRLIMHGMNIKPTTIVIFQTFLHRETPNIIFHIQRNPCRWKRQHPKGGRGSWYSTEITPILLFAGQILPRYFDGHLVCFVVFQTVYVFISRSVAGPLCWETLY
jgi:hypothetical protein